VRRGVGVRCGGVLSGTGSGKQVVVADWVRHLPARVSMDSVRHETGH